jgi:glycosyltransferase involved in cell wall biosynthesis
VSEQKSLIFLSSHPIQYFSPLYKFLANDERFDIEVIYCSDHGVKLKLDAEFGVDIQWNIPLLEGYRYSFLKNYSPSPNVENKFFGLVNPGILSFLSRREKSYVIIHGWSYCTNFVALFLAKWFGHVVCLRGESPMNQEMKLPIWKRRLKKIYLKCIFSAVDYFLYIGTENKLFYQSMGISEKKLVFTPYSVDNERFSARAQELNKEHSRLQLGLPTDKKIILFCGKLIHKKRPFDLLNAFIELKRDDAILVMVGEGVLRDALQQHIVSKGFTEKIYLVGFVNQAEIPLYYASASVFVMCSGKGETWGLATNEAMNFSLPVVLSDITGSATDLVVNGANGFTFKEGDIIALMKILDKILCMNDNQLALMGALSKQIVQQYSFDAIAANLSRLSSTEIQN